MKKVTILLPAYNEEASFPALERCMRQVLEENAAYEWEFLLVNDGSTDGTLREMMRLHHADAHFSYLDLSRNYGKEIAMMAGLDYATGDAVIIMDADMQHPVSVIPEMLRYWEEGYDDVYAQRAQSREPWFKRKSSQWYYRLLQSLSRVPIQKDTGDFRLLDRSCVEALKQMREVERNTKGMYSWIGFHKKGITYNQQERQAGTTKWGFLSLLNLALNGITSYTTAPLRMASILGLLVSLVAFVYLVYIIVVTNVWGEPVAGYPTIMVTVLFLGGVQLLSLGIVGEYLGRVFNEVKRRPGYFVNSYNGERDARCEMQDARPPQTHPEGGA
ncbi:MAG: glycosyltransferase family 2 protein [Muribaculaceae bacterium]|nr:glycosyltransferase family 2 protein [Muribaculaceae bacterium]